MKTILLVDDDALVLELYRKKLSASGFDVRTAGDGLQAVQLLAQLRPDFIVLDLMMPKLTGVDVLKFIRAKPEIAKTPVAALTNSFMSEQARTVNTLGVQHAIVKGDCTPGKLLELINQTLNLKPTPAPAPTPPPASTPSPASAPATTPPAPVPPPFRRAPVPPAGDSPEALLQNIVETFTDLRAVSQEFAQDPAAAGRSGNLEIFFKQAHHVAATAALADCPHVAMLASAVEALLFELNEKPQLITNSTARTVSSAVEFLGGLIDRARKGFRGEMFSAEALAVDDDPLANRIAMSALNRAKLKARAVEGPLEALELLMQQPFDLILLDIEMPQLNGFELCERIRELPNYARTPVIYVTSHSDFEQQVRRVGLGAQDLIAKPILPLELAVKAVMHLLRAKLAALAEAV